jgi:hypothetical protein
MSDKNGCSIWDLRQDPAMRLYQKLTILREKPSSIPVEKTIFSYTESLPSNSSIARTDALGVDTRNNDADFTFRYAKTYRPPA